MKRVAIILLCSACSLVPMGQGLPPWANTQSREAEYPAHTYVTGFAADNLLPDETLAQATARLTASALGALSGNIRMMISQHTHSKTISIARSGEYMETEVFGMNITTATEAEIAGIKTETYFDKTKKLLYAFASVDRRELVAYYTATTADDMQQIKSLLKIAAQLEGQREKVNAYRQYCAAKKLLAKTEKILVLLRALGANFSNDAWQALNEDAMQALERLKLLVYVRDSVELFGKPCDVVANKLKTALAKNNYRFTGDPSLADLTLNLRAATRKIGDAGATIVFCFADVVIELIDNHARESLYKEELSHKAGATAFERAGREALEEAAETITEKLMKIIE